MAILIKGLEQFGINAALLNDNDKVDPILQPVVTPLKHAIYKVFGQEFKVYPKLSSHTDQEKQRICDFVLNDLGGLSNANEIVDFVLKCSNVLSYEQQQELDIPFSYEDQVNDQPWSNIEVLGEWDNYTQEQGEQKKEFIEYLKDKADNLLGSVNEKIEELEEDLNSHELNGDTLSAAITGRKLKAKKEQLERVTDKFNLYDESYDNLNNNYFDESYPEVYQWFTLPDALLQRFEESGEIILNNEYWGRQCCGQSVVLDHVMQEACHDLLSHWSGAYRL